MLRVGINGFGRIGRAIFRKLIDIDLIQVIAINDVNSDYKNLAYLLKYDSVYGIIDNHIDVVDNNLYFDNKVIQMISRSNIDEIDWHEIGCDVIIDASGIHSNVERSFRIRRTKKLKNIIFTHAPKEIDFSMILGVNEDLFDFREHFIFSSSICDATAITPVLKIINENFKVENGFVTTLHPWLNYQNLMDGNSSSWSFPGQTHEHYALGRSAIGNLIPKPTTALIAAKKAYNKLDFSKLGSFSYRTPHSIVSSADLTLKVKDDVNLEVLKNVFSNYQKNQNYNVVNVTNEPLISIDFLKSKYAANIDFRWVQVHDKLIKIVLWYDNEWGYSSQVVNQLKFLMEVYK